jgi:hypothetical protein
MAGGLKRTVDRTGGVPRATEGEKIDLATQRLLTRRFVESTKSAKP